MSLEEVLAKYVETPRTLLGILSRMLVSIPGIQRHYLQGGNDKRAVEIRGKFISKFIESMNSEKIMDLNFIYGYRRTEGIDAFVPVDGQQRLTTLWLLTLYYGKKLYNSNKNTTKLLELLSNFTYDERVLAKRFCHAIADRDNSWNFNETPSKAITDASWFNPFWRNDTTVDNMLNMRGNFKTICQ